MKSQSNFQNIFYTFYVFLLQILIIKAVIDNNGKRSEKNNTLTRVYEICNGTTNFSFNCGKMGDSYQPDENTSCTCVAFLKACCISDTNNINSILNPLLPLDPLTSYEISATSSIIQSYTGTQSNGFPRFLYIWITLQEPPKAVLLPYFLKNNTNPPPQICPRKSFAILTERSSGDTYEAVVNLRSKRVESLIKIGNNVEPMLTPDELKLSIAITKTNTKVIRKCAGLGFNDMDLVDGDPWNIGYIEDRPEWKGRRLAQLYMFGKTVPDDNHFAHPFPFLVIVDLHQQAVISIEDLPTHNSFDATDNIGNVVPRANHNWDYRLRGGEHFLRQDDKPIKIVSPAGASYKITGNQIEWQKWKMRLGFNGREGPIIYTVSYKDKSSIHRPILYRASLVEMFIPYGDPRPPFHRKAVFDVGQYGIGFYGDRQRLDKDVLGAATMFQGVLNNITGSPVQFPNVISLTEEDDGILWKHVDINTGKGAVVRSHRLVLSFIATVGNYDYIFIWRFTQDASIQFEVRLTGVVQTNMLAVGATPSSFGSSVASQVDAQYHQHYFSVRIDAEIDGNRNSVYMADSVQLKSPTGSPGNPYGNGFTVKKTKLKTAQQGASLTNPNTARVWVINNPNKPNHAVQTTPTGYKLVPHNSPRLMQRSDSPLHPKNAFLDYNVWVVPYREGIHHFYPGGFYLNNSGLPEWVQNDPNARIENEDIVLFHMFNLVHIPRIEDWPVMTSEPVGFWLRPYNFFDENPAIDVPPLGGITTGDIHRKSRGEL